MKSLSKIAIFALCAVCLFGVFAVLVFGNTDTVAYAKSKSALKIEGNFAWIGEYPQTICNDEATLTALASVGQNADGYYHYGGERYARCVAKIHSEGGGLYSDGSTPVSDETKYFKVEPIKWIILSKQEDTYLILSETILDTHAWQTQYTEGVDVYAGRSDTITVDIDGTATELPAYDWQYSEMREWLNGDFFDKAFNESAKTFVDMMTTPADMTTSSVESEDYVSLLCNAEFEEYVNNIKDKGASDFAKAQELYYHFNDYKYSFYWLNSPPESGSFAGYKGYVSVSRGYEIYEAMRIDTPNIGVRPLIFVNAEDADVVLTDAEKEAKLYRDLEIAGIVLAIAGAIGVAVAVILDKKHCKKNGIDYKTHKPTKKITAVFVPAFMAAVGGLLMVVIPMVLNGGGFGGATAPDGIYVETSAQSGDGWSQVGLTAFKFESDGTAYFNVAYGEGGNWQQGTWTQSGSTINVNIPAPGDWGISASFTINSSGNTLSGTDGVTYKKQT